MTIRSMDATSMYPKALMRDLPYSVFVHRRADDEFRPRLLGQKYASSSIVWLLYCEQLYNIKIAHKENGVERKVYATGGHVYKVDGYGTHEETKKRYCFEYNHCGVCHRPPDHPRPPTTTVIYIFSSTTGGVRAVVGADRSTRFSTASRRTYWSVVRR